MRRLEHVVRDGLRGARFVVRHLAGDHEAAHLTDASEARDLPTDVLRLIPGVQVLRPVVRLADRVVAGIEGVESGVESLLGGRSLALRGIVDYARLRPHQFAVEMYRIARHQLSRSGAENAFISEQVFAEIHHDVFDGWSIPPEDGSVADDDALRISCDLALAIAGSRPVLSIDVDPSSDPPADLARHPNLYLGLLIGLATAVRSQGGSPTETSPEEVLHQADLVVDARFDRLALATHDEAPVMALAREYRTLLGVLV